ncbi:MAG: hypothetical protein J7639_25745 [Paenibacillaceae bacterium]|nr:hypothetical protein [Paenibacillaceae bacterium]
MTKKMVTGLWALVVSVAVAVPAYAHGATSNGNDGLGNGMGTGTHGMHVQSYDNTTRAKGTPNYDVSVYGTGTGSQFLNVNANTSGTTDRNPVYRMKSATNNANRWGWLGLLGLVGLFGMWNRNPQRDR